MPVTRHCTRCGAAVELGPMAPALTDEEVFCDTCKAGRPKREGETGRPEEDAPVEADGDLDGLTINVGGRFE